MVSKIDIPDLHLINTVDTDKLNLECGAEYVHKKKKIPINLKEKFEELGVKNGVICLTFDGDADRIIYYEPLFKEGRVEIIDGDMILTLFTMAFFKICQSIEDQNAICLQSAPLMNYLSLRKWPFAICQTAYANSASKQFL